VCIGGDRANSYEHAKKQLFRSLDDVNPDPQLAALEAQIVQSANTLGIGTMGFGGSTTLLGCKIGVLNRLPASFFVSVAYDCWAYRRLGVVLDATSGAIKRWLYRDEPIKPMATGSGFIRTGQEKVLTTPLTEAQVRELHVGDLVLLNGRMVTGRDAVHGYLMKHDPPVDLRGAALYHCGPVVMKEGEKWMMTAAGPTTSIREEPYEAEVIGRYGVRAVIGKGGMGAKTLDGCQRFGAVYLHAIGGAATLIGQSVKEVLTVYKMEFGVPEAFWIIRVEDFPAVVTMDSHGNSLHEQIKAASSARLAELVR
jgi:fumarate hydratase class I